MKIPRLAHDGHTRCSAFDQRREVLVRMNRDAGSPGGAECRQLRIFQFLFSGQFEKPFVPRVGAWPAAFDVVNAGFIKPFGDPDFLFSAETYILSLGSVPQRGIIE